MKANLELGGMEVAAAVRLISGEADGLLKIVVQRSKYSRKLLLPCAGGIKLSLVYSYEANVRFAGVESAASWGSLG